MLNGINGSSRSNSGTDAAGGGAKSKEWSGDLDRMVFLRLLVTQLKNQNPMDPMDNKEFLAQLAQFRSAEQMENVGAQTAMVAVGQMASRMELAKISDTLDSILNQLRAMVLPAPEAPSQAEV